MRSLASKNGAELAITLFEDHVEKCCLVASITPADVGSGRDASRMEPVMEEYLARQYRSHEVVDAAGLRLKLYTITLTGREHDIPPNMTALVERGVFKAGLEREKTEGLGYVVVHLGEDATWVLFRAWFTGGILGGKLYRIEAGELRDVAEPLIECVWEHTVAHYERNAWVQHMLSTRDPDGYLRATLSDGAY